MSRIEEIRARVEADQAWDELHQTGFDYDLAYLLDLVERAVPLIEYMNGAFGGAEGPHRDWLRDVREGVE